jgi:hypothetical protein
MWGLGFRLGRLLLRLRGGGGGRLLRLLGRGRLHFGGRRGIRPAGLVLFGLCVAMFVCFLTLLVRMLLIRSLGRRGPTQGGGQ